MERVTHNSAAMEKAMKHIRAGKSVAEAALKAGVTRQGIYKSPLYKAFKREGK